MEVLENVDDSELTSCLKQSFRLHPVPALDEIVVSGYASLRELQWIRVSFSGRTWLEMSPNKIRLHWSSLLNLHPAARRYYFPSYLLGAISEGTRTMLWETVAQQVMFPFNRSQLEQVSFWEFVRGFSQVERSCIAGFIRDVASDLVSDQEWTQEILDATIAAWVA